VLPGDPAYAAASALYNPRLHVPPRAIAFCRSAADLAAVVAFARQRRWPISARSGRHSFAGYSNCPGIVADVSRLNRITFDQRSGMARVGAGATNLDVYESLVLPHGVALPTGTCPSVGIAGLTLGGGFGRMMRNAGLLIDSLVAVELVLADGRRVQASDRALPDLFWACRGGGGGNFGVATEFTYRVHPAPSVVAFGLSFDWSAASAALDAWQRTIPQADDRVAYSTFRATRSGSGALGATVGGHFYGSQSDLEPILAQLMAAGPRHVSIATHQFADAAAPDGCRRDAAGAVSCVVDALPNYQRSDFVNRPLSARAIATLLGEVERWPGGPGAAEGGVQIEALGNCAVNRVPATATAFVHRDSLCHIVYLNFWGAADSAAANVAWTREISAAMRPYVSGFAYQNYIDAELAGWQHAYYGQNYRRLQRIKRRYDPHALFRFRQGITPG
jgi:FAD/FMN-containing dehydrogenase